MELILIRGLPGSGKSTLAKKFDKYKHIETDMFWGIDYNFDITRIKEAHEWCLAYTEKYIGLINEYRTYKGIVVSNTFTTKEEMIPYFNVAKKYGITPVVILSQGNYGSIHGVPDDVLVKMADRFEYDISSLYEVLK